MKQPELWVVEMLDGKRWTSTVGVAVSRYGGLIQLRYWRERNPDDSFRLVRYAPVARKAKSKAKAK